MQKSNVKNPLAVNIKNTRKFQDVVTLVDRVDFRELFEKCRELLPTSDAGENWKEDSFNVYVSSEKLTEILTILEPSRDKSHFRSYLFSKAIALKQTVSIQSNLNLEDTLYFSSYIAADLLSTRFVSLGDFLSVIQALLIKNSVDETDYSLVEVKVYDPNKSVLPDKFLSTNTKKDQFLSLPSKVKIALYISPSARFKDIYDELEIQNINGNFIEDIAHSMKIDTVFFDLRQNIQRDREWYWQNVQGSSYREIAKNEAKTFGGDSLDYYENVKAAVQSYKRLLSVEI